MSLCPLSLDVNFRHLLVYAFFFIIFLIYMLPLNFLVWGDTIASRYLPISIIRELNFDLNEFSFPYQKDIPYFLQYRNGRLLSSYPVGGSLTALPFYLIPVLLGINHQSSWIPLLEKFSAASITAFSAMFFYLGLRRLTIQRTSLIITAIYALCTSAFSISSQALWQHGPSQFFLTLGLYCLLRGRLESNFTAWSGFPFSAAIVCRPTNILMILPILLYLCLYQRKILLPWIISALPPAIFLIVYNYQYFGSILDSGYGIDVLYPTSSYWSTPFFYGLLGVLISPSKGLFLYSPILLVSIMGIIIIWKSSRIVLLKYLSFGPALVLILYSKWHFWWGGETYGPRLVSDITPFLCLYIYPVWEIYEHISFKRIILITLVAISLLVHAIGAFSFDSSWYKRIDTPVDFDRLWSLVDSPIIHYGRRLIYRNFSILQTRFSGLPISWQSPHLLDAFVNPVDITNLYASRKLINLSLTVINTGAAIWLFQMHNGHDGVRIGWRWSNIENRVLNNGGYTTIHRDIHPGEQINYNIEIWPPSVAGKYELELGMISESGSWFGVQQFHIDIVDFCHFEETVSTPLKFMPERPDIKITSDKFSYLEGEIARIQLGIANGAVPRNLKLSVFLRHPDGHIRSLTSSVEMESSPLCSEWFRMGAPHILSKNFRIDWQWSLKLKHMPFGVYTLYALITDLRSPELVSRSLSIFNVRQLETKLVVNTDGRDGNQKLDIN